MSDFDELRIRIERGIGETYRVSASCGAGDYSGTFALPFDERDVELFLLRLGGRGRAGTRRAESSEKQLITDFGGKLFTAVFDGPVGVAYRLARNEAERGGKSLRVTLALSGAPELMKLPWEYLYDDPEFLAISSWTPVVRYLDMPGAYEPLKVELPLRILAMVSSPEDAVALDVQRERENLEQALAGLIARGAVEITWLEEATLEALLRILQSGPFHVFHYIGHGAYDTQSKDGVLLLEDSRNRARQVTGRDLGIYLGDHRTLRLAVLNACEGARSADDDPFAGVATSLVQRKIPAVIAMQFEITDSAAITFAGEFYWKLADCGTVDTALAFARQAIYANNELEWATPVLFMRVPDGRIFDVPEATVGHPEPAVPSPPTPAAQGPTPPARSPAPPLAGGAVAGAAVAKGWPAKAIVAAATVAAAAAALVLGLWIFGGSDSTTTTTTGQASTKTSTITRRWTLGGALPAVVRRACRSSAPLKVPGGLNPTVGEAPAHFTKSFACERPAAGVLLVQYSVARSRADLDDYFNWRANGAGLGAFKVQGTCGATASAVNHWAQAGAMGHRLLASGEGVGRVVCYEKDTARIEWTDPRHLVYGFIEGPDRSATFAWWAKTAGPTATASR